MSDKRIELLRRFETGFLTDAMSNLKVGGWMTGIFPCGETMKIVGRAFTIQFEYVYDSNQFYYQRLFELFELCKAGDVMVMAANDGGAVLGEHVVHAAGNFSLGGLVVDGTIRDYGSIKKMTNCPTFCKGPSIKHAPGNFKVAKINVPIVCGGLLVRSGDYISGDIDGVVAISEANIDSVLYQSEKVECIEKKMVEVLNQKCGMDVYIELSKDKKILRP